MPFIETFHSYVNQHYILHIVLKRFLKFWHLFLDCFLNNQCFEVFKDTPIILFTYTVSLWYPKKKKKVSNEISVCWQTEIRYIFLCGIRQIFRKFYLVSSFQGKFLKILSVLFPSIVSFIEFHLSSAPSVASNANFEKKKIGSVFYKRHLSFFSLCGVSYTANTLRCSQCARRDLYNKSINHLWCFIIILMKLNISCKISIESLFSSSKILKVIS